MNKFQSLIDNLILERLQKENNEKVQQRLKQLGPQEKAEFLSHLVQVLGLGEDYMDITDLVSDKIVQSQTKETESSGQIDVKPAS